MEGRNMDQVVSANIEPKLYKIVPYYEENRGNLKMIGLEYPVLYKEIGNKLVVHIKEDLSQEAMSVIAFQLKTIFGEGTILFAFKNEVSFFVAEPMSDEEVMAFKDAIKEGATALIGEGIK
jgi:hypothetical protein